LSLFFVASVLLDPVAVRAQATAGSITAINGNATIARASVILPAAYGAPLQIGDTIATAPNGRVTITLSDNTQLEVTESSTLVLTENVLNPNGTRASTKVTLLGGFVRSLVRFTVGTPPNFEVHTPNAVAAARGTTYDTDYINGAQRKEHKHCREFTDVAVYDGTVEVSNPTNTTAPPVEVHSGERTTVPCGLAVLPASSGASAAAGTGLGATAGIAAGVVGVGGLVGGLAGAGVVGGSSATAAPPTRVPVSK
jgi:ferric-dicitrate binding protein FerR (iron transport regulator)